MSICIRAFRQCGSCRQLGFGVVGELPWDIVRDWISDEGLDAEAAAVLREVLARLDRDFMNTQADPNRSKQP